MSQVTVLRDDLLLVTVPRQDQADELVVYARELYAEHGVSLIVFSGPDLEVVDLRDAPPLITNAAELVAVYLRATT